MTFNPATPASGQSLGSSRPQVNTNFNSLRTTISNSVQPNHIDVNSTGAGKHVFVQMPVQTPAAANLPSASEGGLITQTVSGKSELFYARDNTATYTQLTKGNPTISASGSSYLPGGLIIQWGTGTASSAGTINNFPIAFPTSCFGVTMSIQSNTVSSIHSVWCSTDPPSTTSFTAKSDSGTLKIFYYAIGN
jgi:hypothetical protein